MKNSFEPADSYPLNIAAYVINLYNKTIAKAGFMCYNLTVDSIYGDVTKWS